MRLIVADDSLLFREGLVRLLSEQSFEVLAQADNANDLVRRVGGLRPDVGVLVLSQYADSGYATRLLEPGSAGRGYLLKDRVSDLHTFAEAIRRVGTGGTVIDPEVVTTLVKRPRTPGPLDSLTDRERECLALMAEGRSNAAICQRTFLSPRTVESHIRAIFHKLGLGAAPDDHRRVLAVLAYLRG